MQSLGIAANVVQVLSYFTGGSILGWVMFRFRKWIHALVEKIILEVHAATYPIQKHANGGDSLPDVTRMLKTIASKQSEIGERTARIEGALSTHLDWHNGDGN